MIPAPLKMKTECDMGRRKKDRRRRNDSPMNRKMSEIIWEFAGDFIRMGDTMEEKESLLNAACSAWSIASSPPELRAKNLDHYMREYQRFNPNADGEELAGVRSNMEKLIQRKLEMFPSDLRQIVGARIYPAEGKDRIEIMSARVG
jgi:hypothetical protein